MLGKTKKLLEVATGVLRVYVADIHKYHSEQVTSQMLAAWPLSSGIEWEWGMPSQRSKTSAHDFYRPRPMGRGRMDLDYNLKEILLMKESWLDSAVMPESVSNQTPSGYLWAARIGKLEAEASLQLEKTLGDKVHSASGYSQSGRWLTCPFTAPLMKTTSHLELKAKKYPILRVRNRGTWE